MDEIDFSLFIQKASRFFKQRDRTSFEVRSFFISKGYPANVVEEFIVYLQKIGLVNDKKFLLHFIDAQIEKGFGKLVIAEKLKRFGFSEAEICQALNSIPNQAWLETCISQVQNSKKKDSQIYQGLIAKGFELEQIESAFQKLNISIHKDEFYESL